MHRLDPYGELVQCFGRPEDTVRCALFAPEQTRSPYDVAPAEQIERVGLDQLYLGIDSNFAMAIVGGPAMHNAYSEDIEQRRRCLAICDSATAVDPDNSGTTVIALFLANHCNFEIAGLPGAGTASAVQQLACQCQCQKQISVTVAFRMVSLAYQVAALSDAVARGFAVGQAKGEDEPLSIQCSESSKAIAEFVEIAGLASVVVGSPLQHFGRPC